MKILKNISSRKKIIAACLLCVMMAELTGNAALALTDGPSQPEVQQFKQAGISDMVDLSTGDFSYTIPLMDIGGYPVTLSYSASNTGVEEEAGAVGLGWNINVGAVTRNLRGVPDDFKGDKLIKKRGQRPMENFEVTRQKGVEFFGAPVDIALNASFTIGFSNYWGYYGKYSVNPSFSATVAGAGTLTQNIGLETSSHDGASISAQTSLSYGMKLNDAASMSMQMSGGGSFNSRQGIKSLDFSLTGRMNLERTSLSATGKSSIDFAAPVYYPTIDWPRTNNSYGLDISVGPTFLPIHVKETLKGFYSKNELSTTELSHDMFGSMYENAGKNRGNALLDFSREKDFPYTEKSPNLPVPVLANDVFTAQSHAGSTQFTLKSGSTGIFHDPVSRTNSTSGNLGVEMGFGPASFKVGVNGSVYLVNSTAGKWDQLNKYQSVGDAYGQQVIAEPQYESYYARPTGNMAPMDMNYFNAIGTDKAVHVKVDKMLGDFQAQKKLVWPGGESDLSAQIKRSSREPRAEYVGILTAEEAASHPFTRHSIRSYAMNAVSLNGCQNNFTTFPRVEEQGSKEPHHISAISVTQPDGKTLLYGLPVYNLTHKEVTMSVGKPSGSNAALLLKNGLAVYPKGRTPDNVPSGRDRYYSEEVTPAYPHSFLLTEMLSPDYQDITGDGITDDDAGDAIKFNYTQMSPRYGYRTPFVPVNATTRNNLIGNLSQADRMTMNLGNYQEGTKNDLKDDKVSYVSGYKEVWNVHSIESRNYYVLFEYDTESRNDMVGIGEYFDNTLGMDWLYNQNSMKRLARIKLFSKNELKMNPSNPKPIKTVHLEHEYFNDTNFPNAKLQNKSKLKLTKVYFTYGHNERGRLAPYTFQYHDNGIAYEYKLLDRWGNYKPSAQNPAALSNNDYPYAVQDKALADANVANWKLRKITLPSGGDIEVAYESDDYAYVQDKRVMRMYQIAGIESPGTANGLIASNKILVQLDQPVADIQDFMDKYLEGQEYLSYKFLIRMKPGAMEEYVQGYAKIKKEECSVTGNYVKIAVEKIDGVNSIAYNAWQFLRDNLPQVAYGNYDNQRGGPAGILKAMGGAFASLSELVKGFKSRAKKLAYCDQVVLGKSFVRLAIPTYKKIGGGHRVKSVSSNDKWGEMASGQVSHTQKIVYDYTMSHSTKWGSTILGSSGVASYEPIIGNEENPFRQPVIYSEKVPLAMERFTTLEEPYGESYFPAPVVFYQEVKVSVVDAKNENNTGYTLNKFYTAKDYPTIVSRTKISHQSEKPSFIMNLLKLKVKKSVGAAQGYAIETNDMAGKPKSVEVFDKGGALISGSYTYYKSETVNGYNRLSSNVNTISKSGLVSQNVQMGVDATFYTDMRYEQTNNESYSAHFNNHGIFLGIFPINVPLGLSIPTFEKNTFTSAASIKLISRTGIVDKVVTFENGSKSEARNLLWDAQTGTPVLNTVTNEFDKPVYSLSYPAYWAYDQMGGAYTNAGLVIRNFTTTAAGVPNITAGLQDGDELVVLSGTDRYWVLKNPQNGTFRIINTYGAPVPNLNTTIKVFRSGFKNLAGAGVGQIVSLENPISNGQLNISTITKVLSASANTFKEEWPVPVSQVTTQVPCNCPADYYPLNTIYSWAPANICAKRESGGSPQVAQQQTSSACHVGNIASITNVKIYNTGFNVSNGSGTHEVLPNNTARTNLINWAMDNAIWNECSNFNTPFNHSYPVYVPVSGYYYLGVMLDNVGSVTVDNSFVIRREGYWDDNYKTYHLYPIWLNAGIRRLGFTAQNDSHNPAAISFSLFAATKDQLKNNTGMLSIPMLTTSGGFISMPIGNYSFSSPIGFVSMSYCPGGVQRSREGQGMYLARRSNYEATPDVLYLPFWTGENTETSSGNFVTPMVCTGYQTIETIDLNGQVCYECQTQENKVVNPFLLGLKNNWKALGEWQYKENRMQPVTGGTLKTDIRNSGHLQHFAPFWGTNMSLQSSGWINSVSSTGYAFSGQQTESVDVLGRYSAAQFAHGNALAVAVGANTSANDMAFESMEERIASLNLSCKQGDQCSHAGDPFHIRTALLNAPSAVAVTSSEAHSGKAALQVTASFETDIPLNYPLSGNLYSYDGNGSVLMNSAGLNWGFAPYMSGGKEYLMSVWVKDVQANRAGNTPVFNIEMTVPQTGTVLHTTTQSWGPVVDGWRKYEVRLKKEGTSLTRGTTVRFRFVNGSGHTIYLDDIRFHPLDAQIRSFVYDMQNFRLMGILDENNYAQFYEYDSEGALVRVKKETEKGVQTIQENRNGIRITN